MHRKRPRRILGILKKVSSLSSWLGRRRLTFVCSPRPCGRCARDGGADGKVSIERLCISLPYVETFKLKGNKRFRTWTKKSISVFRVSGFLCSMYIRYEHSMYVSHICIWLWYNILKKISTAQKKGNCFRSKDSRMQLDDAILEYINKYSKTRTRIIKRIFVAWSSLKFESVEPVFFFNIDFLLLVKSFGDQLYF